METRDREAVPDPGSLPPMLSQYLEYKRSHPDCIIFFQVGDFYEIFFEDAITVSQKLNLTLTSRDKSNPNPVPMCGVPVASLDGYLDRLVALGFSVAVVSQMNSPSELRASQDGGEAAAKIVVQRKLSRIVTPGIRILSNSEAVSGSSIAAAIAIESEHEAAFAWSDAQTGVVLLREGLSVADIYQELRKLAPAEVLVPSIAGGKRVDGRTSWVKRLESTVSGAIKFRSGSLLDNIGGEARGAQSRVFAEIPGYTALASAGRRAVRLLVDYMDEITVDARLKISEVRVSDEQGVLSIDSTTRDNLELVKNSRNGGSQGTLFALLNRTVTPGGERLLRQWVLQPLTGLQAIEERQQAVAALKEAAADRAQIMNRLRGTADLERIAARIELGIVAPRELAALRDALELLPAIAGMIDKFSAGGLLNAVSGGLKRPEELYALLSRSLTDSPPLSLNDGGVIREGFDAELDRFREIRRNGRAWMDQLEAAERERTGISSLKVKFNYVLGYFIEITRANVGKVPENYMRRQSTANAERFTTAELKTREAEVLGAEEKERALERRLFETLRGGVTPDAPRIREISARLSQLDVLMSLAEVAEKEDYIRPQMNESQDLLIKAGRHPVLARLLEGRFIPNSLQMSQALHNCFVITGPNMGGKSTYLRQAGLIVIMAQMGSFVPAAEASIGIVDKIFARIGASDNIAEGESTFMVEMREASHIIQGATARSLLLIDEIGRGTATTDGLAIAQAILEWIVARLSCRALFATHFHELTVLEGAHPALANLSVGSVESGDDVIFTHEICAGPASKSYGIEVAKLACLPQPVLQRAREILTELLRRERADAERLDTGREQLRHASKTQLNLFGTLSAPEVRERVCAPPDYADLKSLKERLMAVDLNNITPLEALNLLNQIRHEYGS